MKEKLLSLAICTSLTAGASMSYVLEHYSGVEVQKIQMIDDEYRLFDKPLDGRIMVTSSIGAAVGQGAASGLTLGTLKTSPPKPRFQAAVESFLASTGRKCEIIDGYLVIEPQWEFRYRCTQ